MYLRSRAVCVGAVAVGLVDHEHVGDLQDARLRGLDAVAHARREQHERRVGQRHDLDLGLTDADGLHDARRRTRPRPARAAPAASPRTRPPRWPRVAIERMKTPGSVAWSPIRTRSPSSAPPENGAGRVDGEHADPLVLLAESTHQRGRGRRLADAGSAGEADDLGAPGVRGERPPPPGAAAALPSSTREISRATARGSPSRARSTSPVTSTAVATAKDTRPWRARG